MLTAVCVPAGMSPRSPGCSTCPAGPTRCGSSCAAVRREHPHPGAQLSLFEQADGWGATRHSPPARPPVSWRCWKPATGQLAVLETRHRAHARVEDRIRHAKDAGLGRFTSRDYRINSAWLAATAIAAELIAWLRLLALTGKLATAEPKALRYRLLHVPAR
jgi:hypothetical protein